MGLEKTIKILSYAALVIISARAVGAWGANFTGVPRTRTEVTEGTVDHRSTVVSHDNTTDKCKRIVRKKMSIDMRKTDTDEITFNITLIGEKNHTVGPLDFRLHIMTPGACCTDKIDQNLFLTADEYDPSKKNCDGFCTYQIYIREDIDFEDSTSANKLKESFCPTVFKIPHIQLPKNLTPIYWQPINFSYTSKEPVEPVPVPADPPTKTFAGQWIHASLCLVKNSSLLSSSTILHYNHSDVEAIFWRNRTDGTKLESIPASNVMIKGNCSKPSPGNDCLYYEVFFRDQASDNKFLPAPIKVIYQSELNNLFESAGLENSWCGESNITLDLTEVSDIACSPKTLDGIAIEMFTTSARTIHFNITRAENMPLKISPDDVVQCPFEDFKPIQDNYIVPHGDGTRPLCEYKFVVGNKNKCEFWYKVPESVDNIFDCRFTNKFKFSDHITGTVQRVEGQANVLSVKWNPGRNVIEKATFKYMCPNDVEKNVDILSLNLSESFATVLVDEAFVEGCHIAATFGNNYGCSNVSDFSFQEIEEQPSTTWTSGYNLYIFLFAIVIVTSLVVLKMRFAQMFLKKYMAKLSCTESRTAEEVLPLSVPEAFRCPPMQLNKLYNVLDTKPDNYEVPRNRIIWREELGKGEFGQVFKAVADSGFNKLFKVCATDPDSFAVKTLTNKDMESEFQAEIDIFKRIGCHPNIVRLLGCCTLERPYLMIMELVPGGNLKDYLVKLRKSWNNSPSLRTSTPKYKRIFFPDRDDCNYGYIEPPKVDNDYLRNTPTTPVSTTSSQFASSPETMCTEVSSPLLRQSALDHKELQDFALQIAKGMSHLEKVEITHRDLAARNVLIDQNNKILKISDFGLSRAGVYISPNAKRLPMRWMALECLVEGINNNKTDVWSFGVLLWEIATLGAFPYENLDNRAQAFVAYLRSGKRLAKPEACTEDFYDDIMMRCWEHDPKNRPTFAELVKILDPNDRKRLYSYVDFGQLNPAYVFPASVEM